VYPEEELLRSHDFAQPHVEAGRRLHGGFDAEGRYLPPRLLVRGPAVEAWTAALRARGGDLLPADAGLLAGVRTPNPAQQKLLLEEGLGQTFWNTLTITGRIEARGRVLADIAFPDLQEVLEDDAAASAVGHLNRGLLRAHGLDEGGEPERGVGGHDVMWFALRDLAFGPVPWPEPAVPATIARPDAELRAPAGLPAPHARAIHFLANLLLIELRAELGFTLAETLLRDPELFRERRAGAERAAAIVGRIRADEEIHVRSLRLVLGELRHARFRTGPGETLPGAAVVDPLWEDVVRWATVEQPPLAAAQQRRVLHERVMRHVEGARVWRAFEALDEA
jgi:hypothetical protein